MSHPARSILYLCKNVPLDNSYQNTVIFETEESQIQTFLTYTDSTVLQTEFTYIRQRQVLRVSLPLETCLAYNYLVFRNSNYANSKYIYAFISQCAYINDGVTEISFEIDVMQTYFFANNVTMGSCWVEREHAQVDTPGANTQPEPVNLGPLVKTLEDSNTNSDNTKVIITLTTFDENLQPVGGGQIDDKGIYNGLVKRAFPADSVDDLNQWIADAVNENLGDGIVAIYMGDVGPSGNLTISSIPTTIDGYTPVNGKMHTYPYHFCALENQDGGSVNLRYELFQNPPVGVATVNVYSGGGVPDMYSAIPVNYQFTGLNYDYRVDNLLNIVCPYTTDTFKAWFAQNTNRLAYSAFMDTVNVVGGIGTALTGIGAGDGLTQSLNGLESLASKVAEAADISTLPPSLRGSVPQPNLMFSNNAFGFYLFDVSITANYARVIDNFFTRYGYATNELKVPTWGYRPIYDFHQWKDMNFTGPIPPYAKQKIMDIMSRGCTFWKTMSQVGNFQLNNQLRG